MTRWRITASLKRNAPVSSSGRPGRTRYSSGRNGPCGPWRSVGKLPTAPVLETMDLAAAGGDDPAVALDHGRDLLALIRMDQKHDFVMTHETPYGSKPPNSPERSGFRAIQRSGHVVWQGTPGGQDPLRDAHATGAGRVPEATGQDQETLAQALVETDTGGHSHVEAADRSVHREALTGWSQRSTGETPQALTLGTQDQGRYRSSGPRRITRFFSQRHRCRQSIIPGLSAFPGTAPGC